MNYPQMRLIKQEIYSICARMNFKIVPSLFSDVASSGITAAGRIAWIVKDKVVKVPSTFGNFTFEEVFYPWISHVMK